MNTIKSFTGENRFLSNFYQSDIEIDGIIYPNAEVAFQAQKYKNDEDKREFAKIKNPVIAKRKGRTIQINVDEWNKIRLDVMKRICLEKFKQNEEIKQKLLDTKDAILIEGNNWHDTFWGIDNKTGEGLNHLGKILMEVRDQLK